MSDLLSKKDVFSALKKMSRAANSQLLLEKARFFDRIIELLDEQKDEKNE
jgi:hypothetical protein